MNNEDVTIPFPNVSRVEVIDARGRVFCEYYVIEGSSVQTQDGGKTLKIFANVPEDHSPPVTLYQEEKRAGNDDWHSKYFRFLL
jgi:hypothetical protein